MGPRFRACEGIGGLRALMIHFAVKRGDSMTNEARFIRADRVQTRWDMIDLEALLPSDHRARVVWDFVERLDLSALYNAIKAREGEPGRPWRFTMRSRRARASRAGRRLIPRCWWPCG